LVCYLSLTCIGCKLKTFGNLHHNRFRPLTTHDQIEQQGWQKVQEYFDNTMEKTIGAIREARIQHHILGWIFDGPFLGHLAEFMPPDRIHLARCAVVHANILAPETRRAMSAVLFSSLSALTV
jgi:hypothetical protein